MGRRVEDNALSHRIFPVIATEQKSVTFDSIFVVREDLDHKTSVHRVIRNNFSLEGPRIVIVYRNSFNLHIFRAFYSDRHHGTMKHEVCFVSDNADVLHIFQKEGDTLVSAVIIGDIEEFHRCFLRIEIIDTFTETECYVSFRMSSQDFLHDRRVVSYRRIELDIHGLTASHKSADKGPKKKYSI